MLTTQIFTNQLRDFFRNKDNKLCFILGAGASTASGIASGADLANRWSNELKDYHTEQEISEWKAKVGFDDKRIPAFYSQLFSFRYEGKTQRQNGIEFINAEIEKGRPGFGYTVFAQVLAKTQHNVIITTNFDTLSEESLYIYTDKRPQVISHENLAAYAVPSSTRPLVLKIHRDRFMDPINDSEGTSDLKEEWKRALQAVFNNYLPIVIGYGGNDGSLMNYLLEGIEPRTGLYWCVRGKEPDNPLIKQVVERHNGDFVNISSFDHLMCQFISLFSEAGVAPIHLDLEKLWKERSDQFGEDFAKYAKETSDTRTPEENTQLKKIAEDFDPTDWVYWELQASAETDVEQQLAIYKEGIVKVPLSFELYNNRGIAYRKKGQYDQAITDYTEAIRLQPDYAQAHYNRGNAYRKKGQYDQAITDYTEAIRLKPDSANAYNNRGYAYHNKGQHDQAITDYTESIRLEPDYAEAYYNRGTAYGNKGRYDQAITDYTEAIRLKPDYAEAYNNRGNAYGKKGQYDQAITDYTEAIRLKPDYADAYYNRGVAYYNNGQYDQAITDYTEAIRLKPDDADAHYNRGLVYELKADKKEGDQQALYQLAIDDYDKALQLKPDLELAKTNLARAKQKLKDLLQE